MFSEYLLLVLGISLVSSGLVRIQDAENTLLADAKDPDWWKTATIYQIYPKSFQDTNGDGIGDLPGVIQHLDYIKDLGVQAIWLSPIFDSPQKDSGYDISDYKQIWPTFGTMENFEALVAKAHEKGLKVIIDFVPNHSSDQHEWFGKSVKKDEGYEDYYVWKDCSKKDGTFDKEPNNWESVFGGSAWTFHKDRKQCYLHQFLKEQPDLNYRNPKVIEEMTKIISFWLVEKKVDGMRIDAVPHIFEAESFENEPYNKADDKTSGLNHTKTMNQPETFELIKKLRTALDELSKADNNTRVEFTEATDLRYYGDEKANGAHFTFNFRFLGLTEKSTAKDIGETIKTYTDDLKSISPNFVPNWVLGNHDTHRIASKVGEKKVDGLNMLTAFLPGIQVTYQGEELGMADGKVDCEKEGVDFKDDCKTYPDKTRDYERTPFQWSAGKNAGFTTGKPWLPIAEDYKTVNVEEEKKTPASHLKVYVAAQTLRSHLKGNASNHVEVLNKGDEKVLHLRRGTSSDIVFEYIFNMDDKKMNITLEPKEHVEILASNKEEKKLSDTSSHVVELDGYESVVVAYKSGAPALAFSYFLLVALGIFTRF